MILGGKNWKKRDIFPFLLVLLFLVVAPCSASSYEAAHERRGTLEPATFEASPGSQGGPVLDVSGPGHNAFNLSCGDACAREYLNTLVDASVGATERQMANIAFLKTHKTGGTTLGCILYRYAARHHLKLAHFGDTKSLTPYSRSDLKEAAVKIRESGEVVDVYHYETSDMGRFDGSWSEAERYYRDIMRDPDNINFVTILREPRSHLISHYYYYYQHEEKKSLEEFLLQPNNDRAKRALSNLQSAEFGVTSDEALIYLLEDTLPLFKLIILTERFDEGLLVLRRMLGWDMIDLTYVRVNENKIGATSWNGTPLVQGKAFDQLPQHVQEMIDELTARDRVLYNAAKTHYEQRLAPLSEAVSADKAEFHSLQRVVLDYLQGNSTTKARKMYLFWGSMFESPPPLYPF